MAASALMRSVADILRHSNSEQLDRGRHADFQRHLASQSADERERAESGAYCGRDYESWLRGMVRGAWRMAGHAVPGRRPCSPRLGLSCEPACCKEARGTASNTRH